MKIILTAKVLGLGSIGDVVEVKNGYAKNFLIPNKKAICMTKNNEKLFELNKAEFEKANENEIDVAKNVQNKLIAKNIIIIENASDDGRLYGSVNANLIANKINEFLGEKIVEKSCVFLTKPIKEIGVYSIKINLHCDFIFAVKLIVSRSESEVEALIKADEKASRQSKNQEGEKEEKNEQEASKNNEEIKEVEAKEEIAEEKKSRKPRKKKEE